METKPNAPATERNRQAILQILKVYLADKELSLLEVGSGTGQHGVFFAKHFPKLTWVLSDLPDKHTGISLWKDEAALPNLKGPFELDLGRPQFPATQPDVIFTANTFHIVPWATVEKGIDALCDRLKKGDLFLIYGPFNYSGKFTSESNEAFDQTLRAQNGEMGIRSFEDVDFAMKRNGFELVEDHIMPANNHFLAFRKEGSV